MYETPEYEKVLNVRSKNISQVLKRRIINSGSFDHVDPARFILTPHMFRKTKAMLIYKQCMSEILTNVRSGINQSQKVRIQALILVI